MNEQQSVPEVVPSTVRPSEGEVANISGNHFDKHGSENVLVRKLMDRFHSDLVAAVSSFSPVSVLDAGCGEGRTTEIIHSCVPRVVGLELEVDALSKAPQGVDGLGFVAGSVYDLPFSDNSFDVVMCTEVLEHVTDPSVAVAELIRVARAGVVITVPREPWWRIANVLRGAYVSHLGNTPGHIQHFTKRGLIQLIDSVELGEGSVHSTVAMWRMARITL